MSLPTQCTLIHNYAKLYVSDRQHRYGEADTVFVPRRSQLVKTETSEGGMPLELRLGGRTEDCQVKGRGNDIPSSGTSLSDRSPIVQNYMIGSDNGDVSTHNKRAVVIP